MKRQTRLGVKHKHLFLYLIVWIRCLWLLLSALYILMKKEHRWYPMLGKQMFRWKWKSFLIPHFAESWVLYCKTSYLMKSLVSFVPLFFSYSLTQTCLSSLLEPCDMPTTRQGIPSPTSPYTFWASLVFIWIQNSLHELVFGILINRTEISPTTRSHGQWKGNWQWKDFTYTFAKCLFAISCIFLSSKSSMMSDVMLPLVANYLYSCPSIWSSTFVDHSTQTWNEG